MRDKKNTRSLLDDIPGVGEKRRRSLQLHFGTISKIKAASVEELAQAPTMNVKIAEVVFQHLHEPA